MSDMHFQACHDDQTRPSAQSQATSATYLEPTSEQSDNRRGIFNELNQETEQESMQDDDECENSEQLANDDHEPDTSLSHSRSHTSSVSEREPTRPQPDLRDFTYGRVDLLSPWFPRVDPNYDDEKGIWSWRTWHSKREILLWTAFAISTAVLITNVIIVAVLGAKHGVTVNKGVIKIFEGSCKVAKVGGILAHVGINILSTLLLGASNLCMQLLVAPTRKEIDDAHQKKVWLDIGIPSWRNLANINITRRVLWALLFVSSIPLHFIYNSAISISIPQYGYATVVASESFIHGTDSSIGNWTHITTVGTSPEGWNDWPNKRLWDHEREFEEIRANANNSFLYERLENEACVKKYYNVFSARSSVVVVTEDLLGDKNTSVHQYIYWPAVYGGYSGYNPCETVTPNNIESFRLNCHDISVNTAEKYRQWHRFDRQVLYCLSKKIDDHCRINYAPGIFIAVCCFSLIKCACILRTIMTQKEPTISTIGDAVASFLEKPDTASAHMGHVTKFCFQKWDSKAWEEPSAIEWRPSTSRWGSTASKGRWLVTMTLFLMVAAIALGCVIPGAIGTTKRMPSLQFAAQMKLPIGVPNPYMFSGYWLPLYGAKGFILNVIYANIWQVVISLIYIAYNALLTCMLVGDEWSRFAKQRKPLRVTHPRGIQRSSYFVSMPAKYGIPLMIANTTLHFLISQSFFIISTVSYLPNFVEMPSYSYTRTGYSTSGAIISICVGFSTVIILTSMAFVKMSSGIPLVSTCSIAISAACHRPHTDTDAHLLPVKWGVVTTESNEPMRCSFTTLRNVRAPEIGEVLCGESMRCDMTFDERKAPWYRRLLTARAFKRFVAGLVKLQRKVELKPKLKASKKATKRSL